MKQAQDSATGTTHSRRPRPGRGTPARRCHRDGEARPSVLPAPSSQPWVSLLLTSPLCPRPRDSPGPPNPPGPPGPGPPEPRAPGPARPLRTGARSDAAPPPRPSPTIGCYSEGPAPRGGASTLPPIRAPTLLPHPARGSALIPPPLPASRTSPRHWIKALSLKADTGADWSEVARVGSEGKTRGLPLAGPRPRPRVRKERNGDRATAAAGGSGPGPRGAAPGPGPGPGQLALGCTAASPRATRSRAKRIRGLPVRTPLAAGTSPAPSAAQPGPVAVRGTRSTGSQKALQEMKPAKVRLLPPPRLLPALLVFGVHPLPPSAADFSGNSPAATQLQAPSKQRVRVESKVESEVYVSAEQAEE